jgi:Tfp pilus assembly protein PilV
MHHRHHHDHHPARGFALIDTLLAALIVGLGMLLAAQLHRTLRASADLAADRSAAVRLADDRLEALRRSAAIATLVDADETADDATTGTRFTIERRVGAVDGAQRALQFAVRWTDRRGTPQRIAIATAVAALDGARAGALVAVPPQGAAPRVAGRSVQVPADAVDLGDGRSAWRPDPAAAATWIVDNRSARVLERCAGPGANGCDGAGGQLVMGAIRFSAAADATAANDAPLPAFVAIVPGAAPFPQAPACVSAVRERDGERALRWACVVFGDAPWSGRIELVPQGWLLGSTAGTQRLCRHASDLDASGAIDAPFEHPSTHTSVSGALTHQNFLVVPGTAACPGAAAAILAPTPNGVFADLGTLAHQP